MLTQLRLQLQRHRFRKRHINLDHIPKSIRPLSTLNLLNRRRSRVNRLDKNQRRAVPIARPIMRNTPLNRHLDRLTRLRQRLNHNTVLTLSVRTIERERHNRPVHNLQISLVKARDSLSEVNRKTNRLTRNANNI